MTEKRTLGQWQAYVEQARGRAEQGKRYREVPTELQTHVAIHMRTVAKVMKSAEERRKNWEKQ